MTKLEFLLRQLNAAQCTLYGWRELVYKGETDKFCSAILTTYKGTCPCCDFASEFTSILGDCFAICPLADEFGPTGCTGLNSPFDGYYHGRDVTEGMVEAATHVVKRIQPNPQTQKNIRTNYI